MLRYLANFHQMELNINMEHLKEPKLIRDNKEWWEGLENWEKEKLEERFSKFNLDMVS
jgi:hypothetical protein